MKFDKPQVEISETFNIIVGLQDWNSQSYGQLSASWKWSIIPTWK